MSMIVKRIAAGELRSMEDSDGLILQNLKEDPEDCVDAVNALFATRHILKNGTKFHDCLAFDFEGKTCLLFPFMKDVELFPGKLAVWLNRTQRIYQGAWLTDFVDDHLGGFLNKPLSGTGRSAANLSFQFHTYPREERMSRQMPDTQNAWTGFDVPDNEVASSLLWLAVFYDALTIKPGDPRSSLRRGFSLSGMTATMTTAITASYRS